MPLSKHFVIQEFVPKGIYDSFGDKSTWFIDPNLIKLAEVIREHFGKPMTINNWHTGGQFFERGFRVPESTTGARYSQHRFGRAIDFNVEGLAAHEVYLEILNNESLFRLAGLSAMENIEFTKTWTHVDIRNIPLSNNILIVNP